MKEGKNQFLSKLKENSRLPEIFQIDCINEIDGLNSTHLDDDCRNALENMIENYKLNKIRNVNVKMNLILKDDEPVY